MDLGKPGASGCRDSLGFPPSADCLAVGGGRLACRVARWLLASACRSVVGAEEVLFSLLSVLDNPRRI